MQLVDADGDGAISFEEFVRMNDKFPMVLYPAFLLQAKIQENTLGEASPLVTHPVVITIRAALYYYDVAA